MEPITGTTVVRRLKRHFTFLSGDQYFGEYGFDVNTKQIFRHGFGSYVTSKCAVYQGKWNFDKLEQHATIKYPNKHTFCGVLDSKGNYLRGTYDFGDSSRVCGGFQESTGLKFHDVNDMVWTAILSTGNLLVTNKGDGDGWEYHK